MKLCRVCNEVEVASVYHKLCPDCKEVVRKEKIKGNTAYRKRKREEAKLGVPNNKSDPIIPEWAKTRGETYHG